MSGRGGHNTFGHKYRGTGGGGEKTRAIFYFTILSSGGSTSFPDLSEGGPIKIFVVIQ